MLISSTVAVCFNIKASPYAAIFRSLVLEKSTMNGYVELYNDEKKNTAIRSAYR